MEISHWKLRVIFQIHFWLTVNVLLSNRTSPAYHFYNLLFLLSLMWTVGSKTSIESVYTALVIDFSAFLFDLVIIGFFISGIYGTTFAIINAVFRLFSMSVLHTEMVKRELTADPLVV